MTSVVLLSAPAFGQGVGDECGVYEATLAAAEANFDLPIWLKARTLGWSGEAFWRRQDIVSRFPDLPDSMIDGFMDMNREPGPLPCRPELTRPVYLVTAEAMTEWIDRRDRTAWEDRNRAVHGVYAVSRAGFDEAGDRALLHTRFHCGSRCGYDTIALLERDEGTWTVARSEVLVTY